MRHISYRNSNQLLTNPSLVNECTLQMFFYLLSTWWQSFLTFDWSLSLLPHAETLSLHSTFPLLKTLEFIMDFVNEKKLWKIECDISSSFIELWIYNSFYFSFVATDHLLKSFYAKHVRCLTFYCIMMKKVFLNVHPRFFFHTPTTLRY